jgi:hypothetical protein
MAGLLGALGTVGVVPTVDSIEASGQSTIQKFFKDGFEVGWLGLFILAGAIPLAPFSFFGYSGLNLVATGSTTWAAAKAAAQAGCVLATKMIDTYYPKFWPLSYILTYNPWYVFDLVQMFNPRFSAEGFKAPFFHKPTGGIGGTGRITPFVLMAIVGIFSAGGYALMDYLPEEIGKAAKPIMKTIFLALGGVTALAGGGIGAYVVLPQLLSSIKGSASEATTALTATPSAPQPAAVQVVSAPKVSAPLRGGGATALGNPGSSIPSLRQIVDGMLGPAESGDPAPYPATMPKMMNGGGLTDYSEYMFFGVLGLLIAGGFGLAYIRSE